MRSFDTRVTSKEFDDFCFSFPLNHYVKTSLYGRLKEKEGFRYHLCAIREEDGIIASALVLEKKVPYLNAPYFYVPYGYNLDYENRELLREMDQNIRVFAEERKAFFVRIDPNVPVLEHEKDGRLKENGFDRRYLTDWLKEDGFSHLGYNYGYSGNWMSRFTYILDLRPELSVLQKNIKNYNPQHNKNSERCVTVKEAGKEALEVLYKAEMDLARKDRFVPKSRSYFENLYDIFSDYGHLYLVSADLTKAYENLKKSREELLSVEESQLNQQKRNERKVKLEALDKEIARMEEEHYPQKGETLLGAKYIIQVGAKVFNVHMYTFKILSNFRSAFALHDFAIKESKKRDAQSYDFEGVSGSLDKKDFYYGIYDFKRSFGGDFVEYPGEFDMILNRKKYDRFRKYDRLIRRWKRYLYLVRKGWFK